jgi:predicted house-cleaning noncanonical NTP pyrophosphatase (MazG superfamily)
MRKEYNKLVRDFIPDIIRQAGNQCEVAIMSEVEFKQALREKLLEESQEAASVKTNEDLLNELADLQEVIDTISQAYGISREDILREQKRKRDQRGGFDKRFRLLWTQLRENL